MLRSALAEYVGTLILVFCGTAVAVGIGLNLPDLSPVFASAIVGLTFGIMLVALASALSHVSGGHFNPAVTLGLLITKKFPVTHLPAYLVAQFLGAITASYLVLFSFGTQAAEKAFLGVPVAGSEVTYVQLLLVEALITFVLMFTIMGATDERAQKYSPAPAIGAALAVAVMVGGPISGGSANPARALGPMVVSGLYLNTWCYIVAPLVGAALAALAYGFVSKGEAPKA